MPHADRHHSDGPIAPEQQCFIVLLGDEAELQRGTEGSVPRNRVCYYL